MKIKPEFEVNGLVFSKPLNRKYSWRDLEQKGFKFTDKAGNEWRVPTRAELTNLFDEEDRSHTAKIFWSSSTYCDKAWLINFYVGHASPFYRDVELLVRLVRDKAVSLDIPEFVVLSKVTL